MLTFIVLGVIPGTQIQITFYHVLVAVLSLSTLILCIKLIRLHLQNVRSKEDSFSLISI